MTDYASILEEIKAARPIRYTIEMHRTPPSAEKQNVKWTVYYETNNFVANGEERWDDDAVYSAADAIERDIARRG